MRRRYDVMAYDRHSGDFCIFDADPEFHFVRNRKSMESSYTTEYKTLRGRFTTLLYQGNREQGGQGMDN